MDSNASFPIFSALPTELRLRVWEEALSVATVLTATSRNGRREEPHPSFQVQSIGSAPHAIGLVCKDSRRQLEHSFASASSPGHRGLFRFAGAQYWLDLERTVFFFGQGGEARKLFDGLVNEDVLRPRIIAFRWDHWGMLARLCIAIARRCQNVHTLIIQRSDGDVQPDSSQGSLAAETATRFAKVLEHAGPEMQDTGLDSNFLRSTLVQYFGDTPPIIHMLQPNHADLPSSHQ